MPLANHDPKKGYKGESKWSVVKSLIKHLETLGYSKGTRRIVSGSVTEYLQNNSDYKEATKTTISDHYNYLKQRPNLTRPGNLSDSVIKVDPSGVFTELMRGAFGSNVRGLVALTPDAFGNVYVAASGSNNVFRIDPSGAVTEIIDESGDGAGTPLWNPFSLGTDSSGNLYVCGRITFSNNLQSSVFRVAPGGLITALIIAIVLSKSLLNSHWTIYQSAETVEDLDHRSRMRGE